MSQSLSPEDVFRLHPKIRWAALSNDGKVVFSQMRPGVGSYTSNAEDRAFMELGPLIMAGVAERLTQSGRAGKLESIIVNLGKDSIMIARVRDAHLAISVDRAEAFSVFQEIEPSVRQL